MRISTNELDEVFDDLAGYIPGISLDSYQPSPECYARYRVMRGQRCLIADDRWMGRVEAYLGIKTAIEAIEAYVKLNRRVR